MAKTRRMRGPKGSGTISLRPDGRWHGRIDLGRGPDGKRDRKSIYGATEREVVVEMQRLHGHAADGDTPLASSPTIGSYARSWLALRDDLAAATRRSYRLLDRARADPRPRCRHASGEDHAPGNQQVVCGPRPTQSPAPAAAGHARSIWRSRVFASCSAMPCAMAWCASTRRRMPAGASRSASDSRRTARRATSRRSSRISWRPRSPTRRSTCWSSSRSRSASGLAKRAG